MLKSKWFTFIFMAFIACGSYPLLAEGDSNKDVEAEEEKECQSKSFKLDIDKDTIKKMDFKTHKVALAPYTQRLKTVGVAEIPVESIVNLSSRTKGVVSSTTYKMGDEVTEEDFEAKKPLAMINSKELGLAKLNFISKNTELSLLKKQYEREKSLYDEKLSTQKDMLDAEMKYEKAKVELLHANQNLKLLGLSDEAVKNVLAKKDLSPLMPIYAPFPGKIVKKEFTKGTVIDPDETLFVLANLDRLNVVLDIYEKDITSIELGQRVYLSSKAYTGRNFKARVSYISDSIDEKSRTLKVWASVNNKSRRLKPGMFMTAEVVVSDKEEMIRIPKSAIQNDGLSCCILVFALEERKVKSAIGGQFKLTTHKVEVGTEDEKTVQILGGLLPKQQIITNNAFLVKSELLKSSFGAG